MLVALAIKFHVITHVNYAQFLIQKHLVSLVLIKELLIEYLVQIMIVLVKPDIYQFQMK